MKKDKISRTAYKVAANILSLGTVPEMEQILPPGIVKATETLLIETGIIGKKSAAFAQSEWAVKIYKAFDWLLPGQFKAFGCRKAFCENQVKKGIQDGAKQVLVLGAGFDTLCWRLAPEYPNVRFFEIDHPGTGQLKAKGIEKMGRPENFTLITKDFATSQLSDIFENRYDWNLDGKTVFIAEGLVMYLECTAVQDLFLECLKLSKTGSRIVFSYIPIGKGGRPDVGRWTGLLLWLQKLGGEPWLWSISPENLTGFLDKCGWKHSFEHDEAQNKYGVEYYAVGLK